MEFGHYPRPSVLFTCVALGGKQYTNILSGTVAYIQRANDVTRARWASGQPADAAASGGRTPWPPS